MSTKAECPGCGSCTSAIWSAFREGRPCPVCGLSAAAADEVLAARRKSADKELVAKYEEAIKRADKAEAALRRAEWRLGHINEAMEDEVPEWVLNGE